MATTRKAPADRKPKAAQLVAAANGDGPGYTFSHEGRTYRLPAVTAEDIPAGAVIDALEAGGDLAEVRLGLAVLKAVDIEPEAMQALRSMPLGEFAPLIAAWLRGGGVDAGES